MKNYLILIVVYVFTVGVVFYFSKVYVNSVNNVNSDSKVSDTFLDVTSSKYDVLYKNIVNYASENPDFVIYVSSKRDLDNIDGKVLFIDVDGLSKFNDLNRLLVDFGSSKISEKDLPVFIVFRDGLIVDITRDYEVID